MGAWDATIFGNDTACDWAYDLEVTDDLSFVEETIEVVLDNGDDYLDSCEAEEALAAAEVIARLQGNFGYRNAHTETVDKWVERINIKPSPELAGKTLEAIDRILTEPSELMELWQESEHFETWKNNVEDLRRRIVL